MIGESKEKLWASLQTMAYERGDNSLMKHPFDDFVVRGCIEPHGDIVITTNGPNYLKPITGIIKGRPPRFLSSPAP